MNIFNYILTSVLISILFIIPGIAFDFWLSKIGAVRSAKSAIIISTIFFVFTKPFIFKNLSWWLFGIGVLLGTLGAVHRNDLRETMKNGKWWWKKEDKKIIKKKRKIK